ncbi:MAG TPA: NADH-quinone oxidoreductase subunit J [Kofleriaceae bacterium]|nr:NADH-quinone oxidoreductase subunit J [Kofleriaceae bacterium]
MIRTLLVVALVATAVASGARTAAAADPPSQAACTPPVEAGLRAALPGSRTVACRPHKTPVQILEGKTFAGTVDAIAADVVLADGRRATVDLSPTGQVLGMAYAHGDLVGSSGKGMALLFWLFALVAVAGAVFVITRKNLIAAVMGMVGSFFGISAVYMMLYAQFLAVVQLLVYAGAIMVLFVFVVMILNRPEDEPVAPAGRAGQALGGLAILYLVGRLIMILTHVEPPNLQIAMAAPLPTAEGYDWGSVKAVGTDLFGPGLFPFEAISILLLVAVVGAIAIARPLHGDEDARAKVRSEGGVP